MSVGRLGVRSSVGTKRTSELTQALHQNPTPAEGSTQGTSQAGTSVHAEAVDHLHVLERQSDLGLEVREAKVGSKATSGCVGRRSTKTLSLVEMWGVLRMAHAARLEGWPYRD